MAQNYATGKLRLIILIILNRNIVTSTQSRRPCALLPYVLSECSKIIILYSSVDNHNHRRTWVVRIDNRRTRPVLWNKMCHHKQPSHSILKTEDPLWANLPIQLQRPTQQMLLDTTQIIQKPAYNNKQLHSSKFKSRNIWQHRRKCQIFRWERISLSKQSRI